MEELNGCSPHWCRQQAPPSLCDQSQHTTESKLRRAVQPQRRNPPETYQPKNTSLNSEIFFFFFFFFLNHNTAIQCRKETSQSVQYPSNREADAPLPARPSPLSRSGTLTTPLKIKKTSKIETLQVPIDKRG